MALEQRLPSCEELLAGTKPPPSSWHPGTEMASSQVQLPPLSEILGDIPRGRDPGARDQYGASTPRESHSFAEMQGLGPSLNRQAYRPPGTYNIEPSDQPDRRPSYASAPSSTNLTPVNGSPGAHSVPGLPSRGPGGLPPLYASGDVQQIRNAPSPIHHPGYGQYSNYHNQEYMPQYRQAPPHGPSTPSGLYPMNFDGVDYSSESKQGKRRRGNLPKPVTDILRKWFQDHVAHPYPTEEEKQTLMATTGLTMSQISNWFINARRRSLPQTPRAQQNDTDPRNGR